MALQFPIVTISVLHDFHAKHFPHAPKPEQVFHGIEVGAAYEVDEEYYDYYEEELEDDLGYYPDGVKRTLTDEQIAMFRHSEIQAIVRKRRLRHEDGEVSEEEPFVASPQSDAQASLNIPPNASHATMSSKLVDGNSDKVQSGRVEKSQPQQWATSSARTKAKNKRNNQKYRRKKRDERKRKEAEGSDDDEGESDEWDPWHQANGPDAQKDIALDLDY